MSCDLSQHDFGRSIRRVATARSNTLNEYLFRRLEPESAERYADAPGHLFDPLAFGPTVEDSVNDNRMALRENRLRELRHRAIGPGRDAFAIGIRG